MRISFDVKERKKKGSDLIDKKNGCWEMQRKKETCLSLKDEKTFLKIIREEQK